jgi:energy-coupling factor transport system permease protein
MNGSLFGYDPQDTWLHHLSGATKIIAFATLSVIAMVSYDTRLTVGITLMALVLFGQAKIHWRQIKFAIMIILVFSVLNLLMVYVFAPQYGVQLYGSQHILLGSGQLFYEFNLGLKYIVTVPLALIFLITTNPSEFAASLNKLHLSYRVCYAIALALRYIPDIQATYRQISYSQQARGHELSKKASLKTRLTGSAQILLPLIFSSLDRIDSISRAMELRRFGRYKKRSWYMDRPLRWPDYVTLVVVALIVATGVGLWQVNGGRFYNPFH